MSQERQVICPTCGHTSTVGATCWHCKQVVELASDDFQDVAFRGVDDGYHSWFSQPTSIHERYSCTNYPHACEGCVHAATSDTFCWRGSIDIRRRRRQRLDGTVVYEYNGWIES